MTRSGVAPVLLLAALVLLAYWPAFGCGFIWDDDDYVTQNPVLRTWGGIARIWFEPTSLPQYYPLVHTTFWLEHRLWGTHPLGYHAVNVLLHLLSGVVLLGLLRRLAVPGALFAAALFAVHPVGVESVAWVTERKNVLSLLAALLAATAWLRWRESGRRRTWWAATGWFVAALLAKTVTASLPAALLVIRWWKTGRVERRDVMSVLPWLVLGVVAGLFTAWLEATHVRASGAPWQLAGAERLLVAGSAVWFYLGSLAWPFGLCFNYPRWQLDPGALSQWLPAAAAVLALGLAVVLRRRIGRAPAAVLLLFGGMLVPALGFFDVYPFRYSYVADHFQYHASVAMLAAAGAGLTLLAGRLPRPARLAAGGALLAGLAVLSNLQVRDYRDLETSWRATLECNPDSMLALVNLGGLLLERGELDEAERLLERCLEIAPDNHESLANLGLIAQRRGDDDAAAKLYERSLAIQRDQPAALTNLAVLELTRRRPEAAVALAEEALEHAPGFYPAHKLLVGVHESLRQWRELLVHADWVLERTPNDFAVRLAAARALAELGEHAAALQNAGAAHALDPRLSTARNVFVRALAEVIRERPPENLAASVARICRSGGIDPAPILPLLGDELRRIGAAAHADALSRPGGGR